MSDDSIVSEEIFLEESLEESGTNAQNEFEEKKTEKIRPQNLSVSFSSNLEQHKHENITNGGSDEEYSYSFDEEYEDDFQDAYSTDFDNEYSQSFASIKGSSPPPRIADPVKDCIKTAEPKKIPSVEIEALQAELALQKLSKEIVFLRNKQRESLQQRRAEVVEKKRRAEERRRRHSEELEKLRASDSFYKAELDRLTQSNESLSNTIQSMKESRSLLESQLEASTDTVAAQSSEISHLRDEVSRMKKEAAAAEQDARSKETAWLLEKSRLDQVILECQSEVKVLTKSVDATELRLQQERKTLPEHHQHILEDRLRHMEQLEESVARREEALKVEQEQNRLLLDSSRKQLEAEFERKQSRARNELDIEMELLGKERTRVRQEKKDFETLFSLERSQLDSWRLDISRRENALTEKEIDIEKEHSELLIATQQIEPDLQRSHQERLQARNIRAEAERMQTRAQESSDEVERSARDVAERELRVQEAWDKLEAARISFRTETKDSEYKYKAQKRNQSILLTERRKLHACALELSRQYAKIQQSMLLARKMGLCKNADDGAGNVIELQEFLEDILCADADDGVVYDDENIDQIADQSDYEFNPYTREITKEVSSFVPRASKYLENVIQELSSGPKYHSDARPVNKHQTRRVDLPEHQQTKLRNVSESVNVPLQYHSFDFGLDPLAEQKTIPRQPYTCDPRSNLLDSLEYSFQSLSDINGAESASSRNLRSSNTDAVSSLRGLKVSMDAMKNAAFKYGIS